MQIRDLELLFFIPRQVKLVMADQDTMLIGSTPFRTPMHQDTSFIRTL